MQYYVDINARRPGAGIKEPPFKTIQAAADIVMPGDEVLVAPGIYREYVNPKHAGTETERIVYRSIEPLQAIITGAEPLTGWEPVEGEENVWTVRVKNTLFGDYNPYTTKVSGDCRVELILSGERRPTIWFICLKPTENILTITPKAIPFLSPVSRWLSARISLR